jgi:hypothetical protein
MKNKFMLLFEVLSSYVILRNFVIPPVEVRLTKHTDEHTLIGIANTDCGFVNNVMYWVDGHDLYGPPVFKVSKWYVRRVKLTIE